MSILFVVFLCGFAVALAGAGFAGVKLGRSLRGAPPRPEWIRERIARRPERSRAAQVAVWLQLMVFVVPGILLVALADEPLGRVVGISLLVWPALHIGVFTWYVRSGRLAAKQQKLLAESEAYWATHPRPGSN